MRTHEALAPLSLAVLTSILAGCPTEPSTRAKEGFGPEDEWTTLAPSKEWLHATSDFPAGPHKAECDHVYKWIDGEEKCQATLCEHGRDLALDWATRCARYEPPQMVERARSVGGQYAQRASAPPTACAKALGEVLAESCGEDKTCLDAGQKWATRCAKAEGTPLVMRILERHIERRLPEPQPIKLDPRTCEELVTEVREAGKCKDRFACSDVVPRVDAYRARCESDEERPTIAIAVAELSVYAMAGRPTPAVLVKQGTPAVKPEDLPVALADGSGGIISVCEERSTDMARYYTSRRGCTSGRMVVARAFKAQKGIEVRAGSLDFPDDATFLARYPTVLAAKEQEMRDKDAVKAVSTELDKIAGIARTNAPEAATMLVKLMAAHAGTLRRSPELRVAAALRDEGLAPALRELGARKVAALKGKKVDPGDAAGVIQRAKSRAFADVALDGSAAVGATNGAWLTETLSLWPKAMEAHAAAMRSARARRVDPRVSKAVREKGLNAGRDCASWERKLQESKQALLFCNFGIEACDATRTAELLKALDDTRIAAESAFRDLDHARTGAAIDASDEISRAADQAGCREPWW